MENHQPTVTMDDAESTVSMDELHPTLTAVEKVNVVRMTRPGRVLRMEDYHSVRRLESPRAGRRAIQSYPAATASAAPREQTPVVPITNRTPARGIPVPGTNSPSGLNGIHTPSSDESYSSERISMPNSCTSSYNNSLRTPENGPVLNPCDYQLISVHNTSKPMGKQQIPKPQTRSPSGNRQIPGPSKANADGKQQIPVSDTNNSPGYHQRSAATGGVYNGHTNEQTSATNGLYRQPEVANAHGSQIPNQSNGPAVSGVPKRREIPRPSSTSSNTSAKSLPTPTKSDKLPVTRRSEPIEQNKNSSVEGKNSKAGPKLARSQSDRRDVKPYVIHKKIKPVFLSQSSSDQSFQRTSKVRSSDRLPRGQSRVPSLGSSEGRRLVRGSSVESESPPSERREISDGGARRQVGRVASFRSTGSSDRPASVGASSGPSSYWSDSSLSTPGQDSPSSARRTASPASDQANDSDSHSVDKKLERSATMRKTNSPRVVRNPIPSTSSANPGTSYATTRKPDSPKVVRNPVLSTSSANPSTSHAKAQNSPVGRKEARAVPKPTPTKTTLDKKTACASASKKPDRPTTLIPRGNSSANAKTSSANASPTVQRKFGGNRPGVQTPSPKIGQRKNITTRVTQGKANMNQTRKVASPTNIQKPESSKTNNERQSKIPGGDAKTENFNTLPKPKNTVGKKVISGSDENLQNVIRIYPKYKPKPNTKMFTKEDVNGSSTPKLPGPKLYERMAQKSVPAVKTKANNGPSLTDRKETARQPYIKPPLKIIPKQYKRLTSDSFPPTSINSDSGLSDTSDQPQLKPFYKVKPQTYPDDTINRVSRNKHKSNGAAGTVDRIDLTTPDSEPAHMILTPEMHERMPEDSVPKEPYKVFAVMDIPDKYQIQSDPLPLSGQDQAGYDQHDTCKKPVSLGPHNIGVTHLFDWNNNSYHSTAGMEESRQIPTAEVPHVNQRSHRNDRPECVQATTNRSSNESQPSFISSQTGNRPNDNIKDSSGQINLGHLLCDVRADPAMDEFFIGPGVTLPYREETPSPGEDNDSYAGTVPHRTENRNQSAADWGNHFSNYGWNLNFPTGSERSESEEDRMSCDVKIPPVEQDFDSLSEDLEMKMPPPTVMHHPKQSIVRVVEYNHSYRRIDSPVVIRKTTTIESRTISQQQASFGDRSYKRASQPPPRDDRSAEECSESPHSTPRPGSPDPSQKVPDLVESLPDPLQKVTDLVEKLSASQDNEPFFWQEVLVIDGINLVMTCCKNGPETLIRIDRLGHSKVDIDSAYHVAEGPFQGIVINNLAKSLPDVGKPDSQMEFMVQLTNLQHKDKSEGTETRKVRFWFKPLADNNSRSTNAKDYFKALLQPEHFPKDYVNFIKKAIVLAQHFPDVLRIELSMKPDKQQIREEVVVPNKAAQAAKMPGILPGVLQTNSGAQFARKLEDEVLDDGDDDNEDIIENFITVLTPALYDYQYLPEVPVSDKSHVCFTIKAKADAHIALSSVYGDTERKTYEIILGAEENTKSAIRDGGQGDVVEEAVTLKIIDEDDPRAFWLSWDRGMVQVGEGRRRGMDTFLRWKVPPHKQHSVNCIAVSTGPSSKGQWEFVELIRPMKPEDSTKAARRARFRMSLLWLAKKERMLQVLEDAYPNSVHTADLLKQCNIKLHDMMTAVVFLKDLQKRNLITEVTKGVWMRCPGSTPDNSHVVKMVKDIPVLTGRETPTIAIITAMYCEKLAVDAMMENKVSFVQYKTEGSPQIEHNGELDIPSIPPGDSQVYTVGRIGHNQVVSTKLSKVGSKSAAAISAGNTITRLLGIFNKVEHVFVVGCGGSVPDYHDYDRHVRLGDIVVGCPTRNNGPVYIHCDNMTKIQENPERYDYKTKGWTNKDTLLQSVVDQLKKHETGNRQPWSRHLDEGKERLHSEESSFHRPSSKKDRLYAIVDNESVQVEHPRASGYRQLEHDNKSRIRYGPIGSSKYVARNDRLRMEFAENTGVKAYDAEFGPVLDAIEGSRRASYLVIRGVADYVDGTKNKEWQPYASLAAAAYMKAIISAMPTVRRGSHHYD